MEVILHFLFEFFAMLQQAYYLYVKLVLGNFPHSNLYFVAGNALNAATRTAEATKGKEKLYWLHSLLTVILSGFGGGFLAPMLIGKPIMPAANDAIIPMCILAWYATHYMGLLNFLQWTPVKVIWTVWLALFRTHSVCNNVKNALTVLKPGPYYPIPLVGPIICGTTVGSMGQFFPLDKGLSVVQNGTPWPIQGAFLSAVFFHLMVHDETGFLGTFLRSLIGKFNESECKIIIATMQIVNLLLQAVFHPDANIFSPLHKFAYFLFQVDGPKGANAKKKPLDTVGWSMTARTPLEYFLEFGRFVVVIIAIAAHMYVTLPESSVSMNRSLEVNKVIGTCQALDSVFHCTPYVMRLENTGSTYSLVSYVGKASKRSEWSKPVWSNAFDVNPVDSSGSVSLKLISGGNVVLSKSSIDNSATQILWSSGELCPNIDVSNYFQLHNQPFLAIGNDGSLQIYCDPLTNVSKDVFARTRSFSEK